MAQVNVTINGRVYRMACEDGQEGHLQGLAQRLDDTIGQLRNGFGEIGDQRLIVMAAIMSMDELDAAQRTIRGLEAENRGLKESRAAMIEHQGQVEAHLARQIEEAARRIETIAGQLMTLPPGG